METILAEIVAVEDLKVKNYDMFHHNHCNLQSYILMFAVNDFVCCFLVFDWVRCKGDFVCVAPPVSIYVGLFVLLILYVFADYKRTSFLFF